MSWREFIAGLAARRLPLRCEGGPRLGSADPAGDGDHGLQDGDPEAELRLKLLREGLNDLGWSSLAGKVYPGRGPSRGRWKRLPRAERLRDWAR